MGMLTLSNFIGNTKHWKAVQKKGSKEQRQQMPQTEDSPAPGKEQAVRPTGNEKRNLNRLAHTQPPTTKWHQQRSTGEPPGVHTIAPLQSPPQGPRSTARLFSLQSGSAPSRTRTASGSSCLPRFALLGFAGLGFVSGCDGDHGRGRCALPRAAALPLRLRLVRSSVGLVAQPGGVPGLASPEGQRFEFGRLGRGAVLRGRPRSVLAAEEWRRLAAAARERWRIPGGRARGRGRAGDARRAGAQEGGGAVAGRGAEAAGGVDRRGRAGVADPRAGGRDEECVAAAGDLPGDGGGHHHAAAAAGRRGADGAGRGGVDEDADVRGGVQRVRRSDPVADRAGVLLREGVHQDGAGQPRGVPVREGVREDVAGAGVQPGVRGGAAGAGDSVGVGARGRDLPAAGEGAVPGVREQGGRRDGAEAGVVADADVLPDVGDHVGDVSDGDGGEPAEREPGDGGDRAGDHVDGLGGGGVRAGAGVAAGDPGAAVRGVPAGGEEQPGRAAAGAGEFGEDGSDVEEREDHGRDPGRDGWALDLRKHVGCGCCVCCHSGAVGSSDDRRGYVEGVFGRVRCLGHADVVRGADRNGRVLEQVRIDRVVQPECGEGGGRVGPGMASVVRDIGVAVLLLALLLRERGGAHRSDVHSVPFGVDGAGHAAAVRSVGVGISVESDGRVDSLRNRVGSGVLRGRVRAAVSVVGLRVSVQRGEHHHLARSWRCVVEVLGPVVEFSN